MATQEAVTLMTSVAGSYDNSHHHRPLDKMVAILANDIFKCIFLHENNIIPILISLKFVPRRPITNNPALVQVMAWHRAGDKPLPEPMLTQFTDANMQH